MDGFQSNNEKEIEEENGENVMDNDEEAELAKLEEMRRSLLAELHQQEDGDEEEELPAEENDLRIKVEMDSEKDEDEQSEGESDQTNSSIATSDEELLENASLSVEPIIVKTEEIDSLLEQSLEHANQNGDKSKFMSKRLKRVLEYRGMDHFDVLPDGWVEITHVSGLPVYLHRPTRCCTFARPYFIGRGSVRNHKVPESAIPCLFQRKIREEMEKERNSQSPTEGDVSILSRISAPSVKVKTEDDLKKAQLNPDQLYEYAKNCFKFKDICVVRFRKWSEARNFYKKKKARQSLNQSIQSTSSGRGAARPSRALS